MNGARGRQITPRRYWVSRGCAGFVRALLDEPQHISSPPAWFSLTAAVRFLWKTYLLDDAVTGGPALDLVQARYVVDGQKLVGHFNPSRSLFVTVISGDMRRGVG